MTNTAVMRTYFAEIDLAAGELGGLSVSPLLPGDALDAVRIVVRTATPHADVMTGIDVTIGLYMMTGRLGVASAAEIGNGLQLMPPIPFPLLPTTGNGTTSLGYLNFEIPTIFVAGQLERYLGVTVQAPANVGIVGTMLAKVFRQSQQPV